MDVINAVIPHLRALPVLGKWVVFCALTMISVVVFAALIFGAERPRWSENTGDPEMNERMKALNELPAKPTPADLRRAIRPIFSKKAFLPKPGHESWADFLWVICLTRKVLTRYGDDQSLDNNPDMRRAIKTAAAELMLLQDDVALAVWKDGSVVETAMKDVENREKFVQALGAGSTPPQELWSTRETRMAAMWKALGSANLADDVSLQN